MTTAVLITIALLELAAAGGLLLVHRRLTRDRAATNAAASATLDERARELDETRRGLNAREERLRADEIDQEADRIPVLTEVLINTKRPDDQAIRGLVDLTARGAVLQLVDARIIDGDNELPAPNVRVERDHVAYMQVL